MLSIQEERGEISKDGMYYMWFIVCGLDGEDGTVDSNARPSLSGSTTWKNPYG